MNDYGRKIDENRKRNEKYINEFENWLIEKGFVEKTIIKHVNNVDLYINEYLNYYDIIKAEDGINFIYSFLGGWFIEKCSWSSKTSLQEIATSIKKFYQYMSENNYVKVDDYKAMCNFIKENMDKFLRELDEYYEEIYCDLF